MRILHEPAKDRKLQIIICRKKCSHSFAGFFDSEIWKVDKNWTYVGVRVSSMGLDSNPNMVGIGLSGVGLRRGSTATGMMPSSSGICKGETNCSFRFRFVAKLRIHKEKRRTMRNNNCPSVVSWHLLYDLWK